MVVESLLFCLREGVPREGLSYIDFLSTSGIPSSAFVTALLQGPTRFGLSLFRFHPAAWIHPPPSARPFSKGLPTSDYLSFAFTPLRGSILRLRRAPSLRGYPIRDYLSFAFAPLRGSILRLRRAPSLRDHSLRDYLTFAFTPLRGSILRPRRAPSLRGYPIRDYLTFAFIPLRQIGFKQSQTFLDDVFYVLPHVFEVVLDVEV